MRFSVVSLTVEISCVPLYHDHAYKQTSVCIRIYTPSSANLAYTLYGYGYDYADDHMNAVCFTNIKYIKMLRVCYMHNITYSNCKFALPNRNECKQK